MTQDTVEPALRDWLESDTGQHTLSQVAGAILKKIAHRKVILAALGVTEADVNDRRRLIAAIQTELVILVLENRMNIAGKLLAPEANPGLILAGFLLKNLLDRARSTPRGDLFRYLYKRAADTFRESPEIFLKSKDGRNGKKAGSLYSLEAESREIGPLTEEILTEIPFPAAEGFAADLAHVKKGKTLVFLGKRFWEQLSELFSGKPIWIELRGLIHWIGHHVSLSPRETEPMAEPAPGSDKDTETVSPEMLLDNRDYPSEFDPARVCQWAEVFSNRLTEKEQQAFCLKQRGLTLEAMAARMGFRTPSGPANVMAGFSEKLLDFVAELPWLSADGPIAASDRAREFFVDTLNEILKKRVTAP